MKQVKRPKKFKPSRSIHTQVPIKNTKTLYRFLKPNREYSVQEDFAMQRYHHKGDKGVDYWDPEEDGESYITKYDNYSGLFEEKEDDGVFYDYAKTEEDPFSARSKAFNMMGDHGEMERRNFLFQRDDRSLHPDETDLEEDAEDADDYFENVEDEIERQELEEWGDDTFHDSMPYWKSFLVELKEGQDDIIKDFAGKMAQAKHFHENRLKKQYLKNRRHVDRTAKQRMEKVEKRGNSLLRKEQMRQDPNYFYYPEIDWFVSRDDLLRDVVRQAIPIVLKNASIQIKDKRRLLDNIIINLKKAERVPEEKAKFIADLYESVAIPTNKLAIRTELEKDSEHGLRLPYKHAEVFEALERELDPEVIKIKYEEAT